MTSPDTSLVLVPLHVWILADNFFSSVWLGESFQKCFAPWVILAHQSWKISKAMLSQPIFCNYSECYTYEKFRPGENCLFRFQVVKVSQKVGQLCYTVGGGNFGKVESSGMLLFFKIHKWNASLGTFRILYKWKSGQTCRFVLLRTLLRGVIIA